jgi:hypothetical protein
VYKQRPSISQAMPSTTAAVAAPATLATNDTQTPSARHRELRPAPSSARRNQIDPAFNQRTEIPSTGASTSQDAEYKIICQADADAAVGLKGARCCRTVRLWPTCMVLWSGFLALLSQLPGSAMPGFPTIRRYGRCLPKTEDGLIRPPGWK